MLFSVADAAGAGLERGALPREARDSTFRPYRAGWQGGELSQSPALELWGRGGGASKCLYVVWDRPDCIFCPKLSSTHPQS